VYKMGSHEAWHLKTYFRGGPDDDLIIRPKHVAFYVMKNKN